MSLNTYVYPLSHLEGKSYYTLLVLVSLLVIASCSAPEASDPLGEFRLTATPETPGYTADEASSHVGEKATVCGIVADTNYASSSNGRPTFLNFDKPYPRHKFTVVIWSSERSRFPNSPESFYRNKSVCANGLIEMYSGKAQIVARTESQLVVQ
jgi:hypothetical protein